MSKPWPLVQLGEILTERQETPSPGALAAGEVRIVSKIGFGDGRIQLRSDGQTKTGMILVRPGDLVVSGINAAKGAIAIYGEENTEPIAATIHYGAYIPNKTRADVKFLWWLLRSRTFRDLLLEYVPGGIKTELKAKRLLPIPVSLPSLPEQHRIVARIEELSAKIEAARALRLLAENEAEALVSATRRALIGEAPQPDWIPLSTLVEKIENGKSPACEARPANMDEWGVLKVGAVSFGIFDERENKALPLTQSFDPIHEVKQGDFLMSRANTTELVGACTIIGKTRPRLLLSDKTFRFHFRPETVLIPSWLNHVMKSPALREQISRGASGTSPTMKNISKEKVLALMLPPHNEPEQRRIISELDVLQAEVDALKHLQSETTTELDALLPAALDRAFKGELH